MLKTVDAMSFFSGNRPGVVPSDAPAPDWTFLINRTTKLDPSQYPLETLKTILRCEHERTGAGVKTFEAIDSIDDDTVFVAGGQQAGLFGGPLYTLYKALHAVRLSNRLSVETGRKVLPLFWIASDDHDFDEVRGIGVRTAGEQQLRVEYTPASYCTGMPVGSIMLDDGINEAIQHLSDTLSTGDRTGRYLNMIRSTWKPGTAWTDAFAAQMLAMCSSFGLIVIDPRWKGVKELFSRVMAEEIKNPLLSTSLVNREADTFESIRKRKKALRKPSGSTNLLLEVEGKRYPLRFDGRQFLAGTESFTEAELLDMLNTSPGNFSPGAALRPVCQDAFLPVTAIISGPGERLYLQQVKQLYNLFGIDGSTIWPRASFTLIDHRVIRISRKEGIHLERLFENPERLRSELAYASFPEDIKNELDSLESSIIRGFDRLGNRITTLDPTLVQSVEKEKGKVIHGIEGLRGKAVRVHKASVTVTEKRFQTAIHFMQPAGGPQERWFGADAAFISLGEEGLDELLSLTSPGEEIHRLVFIET